MSQGYLLDTNVLSEMRKKHPSAEVLRFIGSKRAARLFVSSLSLGELRRGEALKRKSDPASADALRTWIDWVETHYNDRIVNVDSEIAKLWGVWSAQRSRPVVDTLIAASASVHNLILVTRNVSDVHDLPITIVNPWESR